jgi:translation initiation factor 1
MTKKPKPDGAAPSSPFASLASLRDRLPPGEAARAEKPPVEKEPEKPRGPARAVVRYERKGRGGKEATVVEQLGLSASELDVWCRDLKRALGCGGTVEGSAIALAGDQRRRLPPLLEARGVRRVTVG